MKSSETSFCRHVSATSCHGGSFFPNKKNKRPFRFRGCVRSTYVECSLINNRRIRKCLEEKRHAKSAPFHSCVFTHFAHFTHPFSSPDYYLFSLDLYIALSHVQYS
ncbi:hypothetical protein AA313_de0203685 [Arthrobotrys entomopaga]|nr:hypothetical protein AA313_de0203685 [Arthrobotrys entomopaga]